MIIRLFIFFRFLVGKSKKSRNSWRSYRVKSLMRMNRSEEAMPRSQIIVGRATAALSLPHHPQHLPQVLPVGLVGPEVAEARAGDAHEGNGLVDGVDAVR